MAHPNPLQNARVLVIGGTSGIGKAVASAALANGALVHISSSNKDKQDSATRELQSFYPNAKISASVADLSNIDTVETNVQAILDSAVTSTGGVLDHIVYTAGDQLQMGPLNNVTISGSFKPWTVRYVGPLSVGKVIAANPGKYIKSAPTSSITLTSGVAVHRPQPGMASGISAAAAVETLAKSLAVELQPIRSNAILPGLVYTPLVANWGEEVLKGFAQQSLTKMLGTVEAAAEAYVFTMKSTLATGQSYVIDSGYLAQ